MWHVSSRSAVATLRTAIHLLLTYLQQVGVQLPTSAVDATLLAFAAERRAAAPLLLTAGRAAVGRYLCPSGAQQQTPSSGVRRANGTDGRTDRRTLDRYVDPAAHTMRPVSVEHY